MKYLFSLICFAGLTSSVLAQEVVEKVSTCEAMNEESVALPLFAEQETANLSNTTTLSGYESKTDKIKLMGIVYEADGTTPAKDVVLYIEQANEEGEYEIVNGQSHRLVNHSGMVKTDANGAYTFYTFIPGHTKEKLAYQRTKRAEHIHILVKEPGKQVYDLPAFVFDNDFMVTKYYKKRLKKLGYDNVLTLEESDGVQVAQKNIVLKATSVEDTRMASK